MIHLINEMDAKRLNIFKEFLKDVLNDFMMIGSCVDASGGLFRDHPAAGEDGRVHGRSQRSFCSAQWSIYLRCVGRYPSRYGGFSSIFAHSFRGILSDSDVDVYRFSHVLLVLFPPEIHQLFHVEESVERNRT